MKIKLTQIKSYLLLVLLSSFLFLLAFITLPLVEDYIPGGDYDLYLKDTEYWSKEYELELTIKPEDNLEKDKKVNETKNILFKRLAKYGVEEVTITERDNDSLNNATLIVKVTASAPETSVEKLISQRFYSRILIPREDVDFADPENQFAGLFDQNYTQTEFTRHDFRNVYVTELQTSSGEDAYFAIFKPSIRSSRDFKAFLAQYQAQTVGLGIDGLVTQVQVPINSQQSNSTGGQVERPGTFAVGVNGTADDAKILNILYNSGVIPVAYSEVSSENVEPHPNSVQYLQISLAVLATILAFAIYLYTTHENFEVKSFIAETLLSLGIWLTYLKFLIIPVDTAILVLVSLLGIMFVKMVNLRSHFRGTVYALLLVFLVITYFLGFGYIREFALQMSAFVIASLVAQGFTKLYLDNLSKVMNNG